MHFTARGRRLLSVVIELVEEIEADFASGLKTGEFERVRDGLHRIADRVDPSGALGAGDVASRARAAASAGKRRT